MRGLPAGEWNEADIRHACRCAFRQTVNVNAEALFLIALAQLTKQPYDVIAKDTLMKPSSAKWLLIQCGDDSIARQGVIRMQRLRQRIAHRVLSLTKR
jgi:hypothetical protein